MQAEAGTERKRRRKRRGGGGADEGDDAGGAAKMGGAVEELLSKVGLAWQARSTPGLERAPGFKSSN